MKKFKILVLVSFIIALGACKTKDANEVSPSNGNQNQDELCDTVTYYFFHGVINGKDTCIVADGKTATLGYGSSSSNFGGRIHRSILSNTTLSGTTKNLQLSKGVLKNNNTEDFLNFFEEGKFGFTSEAEGGYELMISIDDEDEFKFFSTKTTAPTEDNFIEITKVIRQDGLFVTRVVVEASVNAVLYDENQNEAYRIKDGRLAVAFQY